MQLRHLKTFAAAASTLNFTRTGEQVHLAQSSVTEQIQALEAEFGTALFDRSGRKLRLTEAGRRLADYATEILALADEARAAVADAAGAAGALTVGGLETLCATRLPPLLAAFRTAHPTATLQLEAAGSGALRAAVRAGEVDVCFLFGDPPPDPELDGEVVGREALVLIAPADSRFAGRGAVGPADVAGEAFLATPPGCVYRRIFDDAFPAGGPDRPRLAGEVGSLAAIRRMVEAGVGCALLPRLAVADAGDALVVLPWAGEADSVPVVMSWRRRRVQPPALRRFLDAARQGFGAVTPADARPRRAAPCR